MTESINRSESGQVAVKHALVAYGSSGGGTAEIAAWIADELHLCGLVVELKDARSIESIGDYDAVILGGGVYLRRWQRDARRLGRKFEVGLSRCRVWLFSSGPVDPKTVVPNQDLDPGVRRLATKIGAQGHVAFGGRLSTGALKWPARLLARRGMAGDFRDEPAVRAWARSIVATLHESDHSRGVSA